MLQGLRRALLTAGGLIALLAPAFIAQAQSASGPDCWSTAGQLHENTITVDGLERTYLIYAPEGAGDGEPLPLIISAHGFASDAMQQALYSGWNPVADDENLLVVYPQGTGAPARWYAGDLGFVTALAGTPPDDVAFLRAVIDSLVQAGCADASRVYMNGMSNGGGMTNRMACDAADVVTAAGGVAGAYADFGPCEPARPVPFVFFHGTADPIVPYNGMGQYLPAIETFVEGWAGRDGCNLTPDALPAVGEVTGIAYSGCDEGSSVVLYTIDGGGHTWPGSLPLAEALLGHTTQDIDAARVMWDFFSQYTLN